MTLTVSIDIESKVPHYEQLRAQIAALITAGQLPDGTRLPTVHALANDLGVAKGTIARVYQDLERARLVTSARRRGTSVTAPPATLEQAALVDAADSFAATVTAHGLNQAQAHDLLTAALLRQTTNKRESPLTS